MNHILAIVFGISWAVFWLYWIIEAGRSKRSINTNRRYFAWPRLLVLVLFIYLISPARYNRFKSTHLYIDSRPVMIAGTILFAAGLLLAVWARIYIGQNWGMPMTKKEEPELVNTGPYRYIRHPIYTGILTAMLATGLVINFYLLAIFVIFSIYFIYSATKEEQYLQTEFPKSYPSYKQKTKMLVPFIF